MRNKNNNKGYYMTHKISTGILIFFCLIFFNISKADVAIRTDEEILGFNCGSPNSIYVCLDGQYSIKDNIYYSSLYSCDIVSPSGSCSHYKSKMGVSSNQYTAIGAAVQNQIDLTATYSPNNKVIGYQDCTTPQNPSDGITCSFTMLKNEGTPNETITKGGTFSAYRYKYPRNCNSSFYNPVDPSYIPGVGCVIGDSGGNTPSDRTVSSITSSCENNMCADPNSGNISKLLRPASQYPIDLMTGSKIDNKVDLNFPFVFSRSYISKRPNEARSLGYKWRHNYDKNSLKKLRILKAVLLIQAV